MRRWLDRYCERIEENWSLEASKVVFPGFFLAYIALAIWHAN